MRGVRTILFDHAARYPLWSVDDLYKLIFQSVMGSEHAVGNEPAVNNRLIQEIQQLGPGPREPLIDPISPDGEIVRVHLRPFSERGLDPAHLADAHIQTARVFRGSVDEIAGFGSAAVDLAFEERLSFSAQEVAQIFQDMKAAGYPAVRHSQVYAKKYRPAYRVVSTRFLSGEFHDVQA